MAHSFPETFDQWLAEDASIKKKLDHVVDTVYNTSRVLAGNMKVLREAYCSMYEGIDITIFSGYISYIQDRLRIIQMRKYFAKKKEMPKKEGYYTK